MNLRPELNLSINGASTNSDESQLSSREVSEVGEDAAFENTDHGQVFSDMVTQDTGEVVHDLPRPNIDVPINDIHDRSDLDSNGWPVRAEDRERLENL